MNSEIINLLINDGIPTNILGFRVLAEAIEKYEHGISATKKGGIYDTMAEKFGTTASKTERAIRTAINRSVSIANNPKRHTNMQYISYCKTILMQKGFCSKEINHEATERL